MIIPSSYFVVSKGERETRKRGTQLLGSLCKSLESSVFISKNKNYLVNWRSSVVKDKDEKKEKSTLRIGPLSTGDGVGFRDSSDEVRLYTCF